MKYGKEEFVKDMEYAIQWNKELDDFLDTLENVGFSVDIDKLPGIQAMEHFIDNMAIYLDDSLYTDAINSIDSYNLQDIINNNIYMRDWITDVKTPAELYDSLYEEYGR